MPLSFPSIASFAPLIESAWEHRQHLSVTEGLIYAVQSTLQALDKGDIRVAEKVDGVWQVQEWIKKAILLSFRLNPNQLLQGAPGNKTHTGHWFDKVPNKFIDWDEEHFNEAKLRMVPGSYARFGAYIGPNVVLMPSFVNIGAYIGEGTLVDTWATIGSCAQIGRNCHVSGGTGIGGVLEPIQATPVIIEDNCFIGARSEIAEGVVIEEGSVIGMGVFLGATTKIVDRESGEIYYGRVPAYSVVVPGTLPNKDPSKPSLGCAVIVKRVDEQTRSKTTLNDLLRVPA